MPFTGKKKTDYQREYMRRKTGKVHIPHTDKLFEKYPKWHRRLAKVTLCGKHANGLLVTTDKDAVTCQSCRKSWWFEDC